MLNPHLLQLIRLEVATFGDRSDGLPCLTALDQETLDAHVARLYFGGEITGRCVVRGDHLRISIQGLTPYGLVEMNAFRESYPDTADDDMA